MRGRPNSPAARARAAVMFASVLVLPLSVDAVPRSLEAVVAERRKVLTSSLQSGSWMILADHQNASLVGVSRAKAMKKRPLTARDMETIDSDGGALVTGHDVLAVMADLLSNASSPQSVRQHYMEIGVAQGRNVFGALQVFGPEWHVTAFSFERINPPFDRKLRASAPTGAHLQALKEWPASDRTLYNAFSDAYDRKHAKGIPISNGRQVKKRPTGFVEESPLNNPGFFPYAATRYAGLHTSSGQGRASDKSFTYMHADAYDANAWATLAELRAGGEVGPWQLVLSDAEHTDAVVQYECDRYVSSRVIDFTRPFAVLWDDEMMNLHCTRLLQSHSPTRLTFGSAKVMGRTGTHTWQFAASLPAPAARFLAAQMRMQSVPHYMILPNGKEIRCCSASGGSQQQSPPAKPPSA